MVPETDPKGAVSTRDLLASVKLLTGMNRYQFSVAVARLARDIHALSAETETKSQQKSLRAAVAKLTSGKVKILKNKEGSSAK